MGDLTERLRKIAKDKAFQHHHTNMYAPGDKTTHKDFIEWEAADEIERLQRAYRPADMLEYQKAADEIERLQERFDYAVRKNGEQWAEIERLKAALKEAAKSLAEDEQEIERLRGHYERIKAQTCLCRFDKAAGEGELGTIPHTECAYHKAMRELFEYWQKRHDVLRDRYEPQWGNGR